MNDPIVIISSARTPMGSLQGALSSLTAGELGAAAIRVAVNRSGLSQDHFQEAIMGNVLSAGQGQAPARIIVTLLGALQTYGLKRGIAALCIGGGEATAMAIEYLH